MYSKTVLGNGPDALRHPGHCCVQPLCRLRALLHALVTAVDNKGRCTRRHSEDVVTDSVQIARSLELSSPQQQTVAADVLLPGAGKIGVPDAVLRKPGALSVGETRAMREHPLIGSIRAGAVPGFEETLDAVRHHHERWDGTGRPFGLAGEALPLTARLMGAADACSAMTTGRPYRKGMSQEKALLALQEGAGSQQDPACVQAFVRSASSALPSPQSAGAALPPQARALPGTSLAACVLVGITDTTPKAEEQMKTLYTAVATATGGRAGHVESSDGIVAFDLAVPPEMGGDGHAGTNPEQLFASGYASCFGSALDYLAKQRKIETGDVRVTAKVSIGPNDTVGFGLATELDVFVPSLSQEDAEALVADAHAVCPYSNATKGNMEVTLVTHGGNQAQAE